jgi:hypothetical protein
MNKQTSITVGDRFQSTSYVWVVTRIRPGGVCEMTTEDRTQQADRYTHQIRRMTRLEGKDAKAVRLAQLFA